MESIFWKWTRHQTTTTKKPVWQCMNATKNGIDNCPNCKAVDEVIIENAFLESFRRLTDSFGDVLQSVLNTIENILKDDTELKRVKQLEKDISTIESKKMCSPADADTCGDGRFDVKSEPRQVEKTL